MPTPPPDQPTPAPNQPPRRSTPAYTIIAWFVVLGLGVATFGALVAVGTLMATARPVMQWRVALTSPTPLFQITDADFACSSDTDCTVVGTHCGGCGESFAVNGIAAARLNREVQARCATMEIDELCMRKLEQASCVSGRCIIGPPVPISATSPHTAGWQTYRNDQYAFSIAYPATWQTSGVALRNIPNEDEVIFNVADPNPEWNGDIGDSRVLLLVVRAYPAAIYHTPTESDYTNDQPIPMTQQPVTVGGQETTSYRFSLSQAEGATATVYRIPVRTVGSSAVLELQLDYALTGCFNIPKEFQAECKQQNGEITQTYEPLIKQILSTFKFTSHR